MAQAYRTDAGAVLLIQNDKGMSGWTPVAIALAAAVSVFMISRVFITGNETEKRKSDNQARIVTQQNRTIRTKGRQQLLAGLLPWNWFKR